VCVRGVTRFLRKQRWLVPENLGRQLHADMLADIALADMLADSESSEAISCVAESEEHNGRTEQGALNHLTTRMWDP